MTHLLRVLAFENYKTLRSRLVQSALVATVLASALGAWLAHRGVGLTVPVQAGHNITGYTALAGGASLGFVVAMLFVLIHASNAVARERAEGTLKYGLTAGVPRGWFFLGKLAAHLLLTLALAAAAVLSALAVAAWFREFGDVPAQPPVEAAYLWRLVLHALVLALAAVVALTALAYVLSTLFSSASTALGLSVGIVLLGSVVAAIYMDFARLWPGWFVNNAQTALVETSQAFNPEVMPLGALLLGVGLALGYAVLLTAMSVLIGVRRDVVAE